MIQRVLGSLDPNEIELAVVPVEAKEEKMVAEATNGLPEYRGLEVQVPIEVESGANGEA